MRKSTKRQYSDLTLKEVLDFLDQKKIQDWQLDVPPHAPSSDLKAHMRCLSAFDLQSSEQAKTLLIDALFAEIVPLHDTLKVWKAAPLETEPLSGIADYLIAENRAYLFAPLLCVTEAKKDDFEQGQAQRIGEMIACRWHNTKENIEIDVHGIVSNGQGWQFYKLMQTNEVFETGLYTLESLPQLLGLLNFICGECAKNVP